MSHTHHVWEVNYKQLMFLITRVIHLGGKIHLAISVRFLCVLYDGRDEEMKASDEENEGEATS